MLNLVNIYVLMNNKKNVWWAFSVALVALGLMSGVPMKAEDAECCLMESRVEPSQSQTLAEQIVGTWETDGGSITIVFNADGTCGYDSGKVKFKAWRVEDGNVVFSVMSEGEEFEMPWKIDQEALKKGKLVLTQGNSKLEMTKKK